MKLKKRLTAYPVLSKEDDDYIDSRFDVDMTQSTEFGKMKVSFEFKLENDTMKKLIEERKAAYVAHYECSLLGYRQNKSTTMPVAEVEIDLNEVNDYIEVSTFVAATECIPQYHNPQFNWEYGEMGFDIDKGNVLAIGPTYIIDVQRNDKEMNKLTDIIAIKEYENLGRAETSVELEGDMILIYVNKTIKNLYFANGKTYLNNSISMLMVPAMIYVLSMMKDNAEDLREYRWFQVIEALLQDNDIEVEDLRGDISTGKHAIYSIAQKIFKSPIEQGFFELNRGDIADERGDSYTISNR